MKTTMSSKGVKYIDTNTLYTSDRKKKNETNDCVVRALAAATGVDYNEAHKYAKEQLGRVDRDGTKGTQQSLTRLAKEGNILGKKWETLGKEVATNTHVVSTFRYAKGGKRVCAFTVGSWSKRFSFGTFYVIVRGHALCIKDGVVYGNSSDAEMIKKRILGVWRVHE